MKKYLLLVLMVLIATPLIIAGCTSPSSPSPSPTIATEKVTPTGTASAAPKASATTSGATPASETVSIRNLSFQPASLTIQRGTSVTWRNDDSVTHHIVSDTNVFSSPDLNAGGTFTYMFEQPGTYPYHCSIHPFMTGSITVQ